MNRVLLIVDMKNQVYRAAATHPGLTSGRTFTGGLYGVLAAMCRAINDQGVTSVAFATDTGPYVRKAEFDGYKADRKKETDDVLLMQVAQSISLIKEFLEHVSIPYWELKGYEYDDICAWAVTQFGDRFDRVVAMTNDTDLYQVMFSHPNFGLYRGSKKGVYSIKEFRADFPECTSARLWVKMLSITGTHNGVPGAFGIAEKTALKHMRDPAKWRAFMLTHIQLLERNQPLIVLPHASFPPDPGFRLQAHRFVVKEAAAWLKRYEVQVTGHMVEAFAQIRSAING